jgi:hypothetical protein
LSSAWDLDVKLNWRQLTFRICSLGCVKELLMRRLFRLMLQLHAL